MPGSGYPPRLKPVRLRVDWPSRHAYIEGRHGPGVHRSTGCGRAGGPTASLPTVLHLIGSLDRGGTEHQLVELIRRSSEPRRHVVVTWAGLGALAEALARPPAWSGPAVRTVSLPRAAANVASGHPSGHPRAGGPTDPRTSVALGAGGRDARRPSACRSSCRGAVGRSATTSGRGSGSRREPRIGACGSCSRTPRNSPPSRSATIASCRPSRSCRTASTWSGSRSSPLPSDPVVTIVANLIGYKRHDLFLRAFAIVLRSVPSAQAIVVGDGPERNALDGPRVVARPGRSGRVRRAGT